MSSDDFTIDCAPTAARFYGVMRLVSAPAYERPLGPVRDAMLAAAAFRLDLSGLSFMNSSGVRALAELVLLARKEKKRLVIVAKGSMPWQKKAAASLAGIYTGVELVIEP